MEVELMRLRTTLESETNRRERVELDYARLNDDFRGLIALTAGRVPPKAAPEFDKDIFAEDETQTVTFLSPDPDELGVRGEEILRTLNEARQEDDGFRG